MTTLDGVMPCPQCGGLTPREQIEEAFTYAFWKKPDGACPACVQHHLLHTLVDEGDAAFFARVQTEWPLDAEVAFGALPTPLRLHADPRYLGRGVAIALVDSGFYPHPDLVRPWNRIRAWVDAGRAQAEARFFAAGDDPRWPAWEEGHGWQWHGTMTSVAAAGNGFLSHGLYRSLAPEADVVLIQARDDEGRITNETIRRALAWVAENGPEMGIRVVSLSVSGDPDDLTAGNPVDGAVRALIDAGIVVVAAAGNDGVRRLLPPATAPHAVTVGGLDDRNTFDPTEVALWHSNYGSSSGGGQKPELVAPSIWVAAPILPGTEQAAEAAALFSARRMGARGLEERLAGLKLITPHYQHVDGTSFAAPLTAGTVACMLEANPALTPLLVRDLLRLSACLLEGVGMDRQGAGALDAGRAVALALHEQHREVPLSPNVAHGGVAFSLHEHGAKRVQVLGSWNGWRPDGFVARPVEDGLWQTPRRPLPPGHHQYKFLIDDDRWMDDPANPEKAPDGFGHFNSVLNL